MAILGLAFAATVLPQPAPAVEFKTIAGEQLGTAELRGKVVLVNFWSVDCAPCLKEMPQIARTYRAFQERGFETVAVAMKTDPPNYVLAYAERNHLPFKVALDVSGELARKFGPVRGTPATFVIDRRGNIVKQITGEADFRSLNSLIEAKLKDPA